MTIFPNLYICLWLQPPPSNSAAVSKCNASFIQKSIYVSNKTLLLQFILIKIQVLGDKGEMGPNVYSLECAPKILECILQLAHWFYMYMHGHGKSW